jgi:hypothetical protein
VLGLPALVLSVFASSMPLSCSVVVRAPHSGVNRWSNTGIQPTRKNRPAHSGRRGARG